MSDHADSVSTEPEPVCVLTPEMAGNAIAFLNRVTLAVPEIDLFLELRATLQMIAMGAGNGR